MPRTTLPWSSYKPKAEKLFKEGLKPAQIKEQLGDPYWEGKPWHIKSNGKGGISRTTLKARQSGKANANAKRNKNENLSPPINADERNQNRRQNYKRSSLRKQGKDVVIDHKVDLKLLGETVEGMSPENAKAHVKKLERSYGPLGNRPGNRQIIGAKANELKRQQSAAVQNALKALDDTKPFFAQGNAFKGGLTAFRGTVAGMLPEILELVDQKTNGAITNGINNGVGFVKNRLKNGVNSIVDAYASTKPNKVDLTGS